MFFLITIKEVAEKGRKSTKSELVRFVQLFYLCLYLARGGSGACLSNGGRTILVMGYFTLFELANWLVAQFITE